MTVDSEQWRVDNGEWTIDSGQWRVESGKWKVGALSIINYQLIRALP